MMSRKENSTEYVIKLETVRRCPIVVGDGIINQLERYFDFSGYSGIALLTDTTVQKLYGQRVMKALEATGKKMSLLTLPVGERAKSLNTVERGYRFLLENNIDRKGLICALGGGVVGDVAGYLASTYLRGINYIQLPTTLLAQVDSSIGGKVGVNFGGKKNMVGSFYQPSAIIGDVALLKSLPPAEMRNGLAEVIKYGLAMDGELFRLLDQKKEREFTTAELKDIVIRCCRLKAGIVEVDETERTGQRAILNFGHTVGHALEAATKLQELSHGEAVAIGMAAAARISVEVGGLDRSNIPVIENLLSRFGLPVYCQGVNPEDLIGATRFDKKTTRGQTGWVLLKGIGNGVTNQPVADDVVRKVLTEICR
ncbi:MAG: 3-dehydroquinate synthase [Deltaproteobacteria bacterium]|nr:3-dehydroquinate synthase [Deltaproteobacteria bacterium]